MRSRSGRVSQGRIALACLVWLAAVVHCPFPHSEAVAAGHGEAFAPLPATAGHTAPHGHSARHEHPGQQDGSSHEEHGNCASQFTRPAVPDGVPFATPSCIRPACQVAAADLFIPASSVTFIPSRIRSWVAPPLTLLSQRVLIRI